MPEGAGLAVMRSQHSQQILTANLNKQLLVLSRIGTAGFQARGGGTHIER